MPPTTVSFVSLGCPKNLVDSEKMLGLLAEAGCGIVAPGASADVLVVNTCGFLAASRDEALGILKEAADQKRCGQIRRLVVAGCLVQRDGQTLADAVPEIDALVGVNNRAEIVRAVLGEGRRHGGAHRTTVRAAPAGTTAPSGTTAAAEMNFAARSDAGLLARPPAAKPVARASLPEPRASARSTMPEPRVSARAARSQAGPAAAPRTLFLGDYHPRSWTDRARLRLTPRHYAYLRISEGCNQKCTFCTIPSIRGKMYCKPVPEILREARELIADGAVELNLLGQDTTSYHSEHRGRPVDLAGLLRILDRLDGVRWIRLMYAYPSDFTDEMIAALAECDRVVKYIDMPLQHISDRVLRAMHRRVTRAETESLLARLRDRVPGIAIRTTLIAGFPGETDAEFRELLRFIEDFRFDHLGVFAYSREPETPAGRMRGQLPESEKHARVEALMLAQQRIAFRRAAESRGRTFDVMIDGFGRDGVYPARHAGQAPDIDSVTRVHGGEFDPGEFVRVRCTGSERYDLLARPASRGLPILR